MTLINYLGLLQVLLVIPKAIMAVRYPERRAWHIASGTAIVILGLMMFLGRL